MDHVHMVRAPVVWASAATQVLLKLHEGLVIQLTHQHSVLLAPVNEVFRCPEVSASGNCGVIARLRQSLSKAFKQSVGRIITKYVNWHA